MSDEEKRSVSLWDVVRSLSVLILVIVLSIKIYQTPLQLTVDFPTLLSLLLALFSVALAALFYFKATDTSNTFYDNTYKFTRDVAQLLAKMESGFGERLRHLDEGYSSMRSYLQDGGKKTGNEEVEKTKKKLEDEKQEVSKTIEERNRIVRDLIERSNLQKEEKEKIAGQLKEKEQELAQMQQEVSKLNRRLMMERVRKHRAESEFIPDDGGMNRFTYSHVIDKIGREKLMKLSPLGIKRAFSSLVDDLPRGYIEDLERLEYFDDGLTPAGASYLRALAHRHAL
ncbi:hypothetical protein H0E84_01620 [Luteimonas sp. SJ-92]|uniref:Uncharacterized protein n=1 Tax=Luteimonas salinisoli TaxID=2752307 RepID=A0A853J7K9_9GAMM|nr:hypothetical protein [Luteimonas salinisoli]NZA25073.1 hypothetical protein [Luteimonas salinisoli]